MSKYQYFEHNKTFVMIEFDKYGNLLIGDDMHMNGMDSPARINKEDIKPFIEWLQKQLVENQ